MLTVEVLESRQAKGPNPTSLFMSSSVRPAEPTSSSGAEPRREAEHARKPLDALSSLVLDVMLRSAEPLDAYQLGRMLGMAQVIAEVALGELFKRDLITPIDCEPDKIIIGASYVPR